MALHGSASANLSPILFKGNNRSLGVNILIHQDESGSMDDVSLFYSNGTFIGALQDALISEKIGDDITKYPNLYAYFGVYSRNPSTSFIISNQSGSLNISQAFMRGEVTGAATITNWTGTRYFANSTSHVVNICTDVINSTTGGRLTGYGDEIGGGSPKSEDVHGNLWSIFTTPNAISTGTSGRFGSIIGSNVRKGSTTFVITNSDEQDSAPGDMINQLVAVNLTGTQERTIDGTTGEMVFRGYRVVALSSYASTDGYDGVLFYGSTSTQPYGYVTFTGSTTYTVTRSPTPPNWTKSSADTGGSQIHNTLTLASETRGGLFKINNIFTNTGTDRRVAFSNALAAFISDTV
jgi:hypothetical protein